MENAPIRSLSIKKKSGSKGEIVPLLAIFWGNVAF
jgi:hypothetical protein